MSDISSWSNTAAINNSSAPNGWPEGMAPSGVNDSGREVMAAVRRWYEDAQWINFGHVPTRVDNDTFTVATDLTAIYETGRRLKVGGSATGYCTIASSSYSAPNTTVNVTMDSGNLPGTLSAVHVGILSYTGSALPLVPDGRLSSNIPLKNATNTFSANQTVDRGVAVSQVTLGSAAGGGTALLLLGSSAGQGKNWLVGNQFNVNGGFEITSSTTNGGNTFTTPLVTLIDGLQIGAPTGGDKGVGTVNIEGTYYVNDVAVALANGSNLTALPAISGANLTNLTAANIAAGTAGINISGNAATTTNVTSSTYTPTGTAGTNVSSLVTRECQYMRVGNVVTVSGMADLNLTGSGSAVFALSIPVASNFSLIEHAAGAGKCTTSEEAWSIEADTTNDRLTFRAISAGISLGLTVSFAASYRVI